MIPNLATEPYVLLVDDSVSVGQKMALLEVPVEQRSFAIVKSVRVAATGCISPNDVRFFQVLEEVPPDLELVRVRELEETGLGVSLERRHELD